MQSVTRLHAEPAKRSSAFTPDHAHELLRTKFAPWVQDLGMVVEECTAEAVRLCLPYSPRLARVGNTVSGQAVMACADSAMALAIAAAFGEFRNCTTVSQTISFMRPIPASDTSVEAVVRKLGRSLVFGEVTFRVYGSEVVCAHAVATWALIP
jgi:uncharacterized protein (TIGR00369 family)